MTRSVIAAQTVKTLLGELGLEATSRGLVRVVYGAVHGGSDAVTRQARLSSTSPVNAQSSPYR